MKTELLKPNEQSIQQAADLLAEGELVAFPTETVYGLGANALNAEAVKKIFIAKGRPSDNPLIVHVASIEQAEKLCYVSEIAKILFNAFTPGPLTLLLPKKDILPGIVNAGLDSLAIRIPEHPTALAILRASNLPIAAPSANTSGKPSPTTAKHVYDDMNGKIPLILDGGSCRVGLESTVLDLAHEHATILRPGGVTKEELSKYLPDIQVSKAVLEPLEQGQKAESPGMMYKHYAPKGKLTLLTGDKDEIIRACKLLAEKSIQEDKETRILAFEENKDNYPSDLFVSVGYKNRPQESAAKLFKILRKMDDDNVEVMFAEAISTDGIGLAYMNRILRAAAFCILKAEEVI